VLLSNWRHGVLAICGAIIGTAVSYYYAGVDPGTADSGFYGFNGVLTAVAVFVSCGGKLRLSLLGALIATMMIPVITGLGLQMVSAPYVFTTWLMLGLGWIENRWFDETESATEPIPAAKSHVSKSHASARPAHGHSGK
jgi:urea transporter